MYLVILYFMVTHLHRTSYTSSYPLHPNNMHKFISYDIQFCLCQHMIFLSHTYVLTHVWSCLVILNFTMFPCYFLSLLCQSHDFFFFLASFTSFLLVNSFSVSTLLCRWLWRQQTMEAHSGNEMRENHYRRHRSEIPEAPTTPSFFS